jgi:hypothetical protein
LRKKRSNEPNKTFQINTKNNPKNQIYSMEAKLEYFKGNQIKHTYKQKKQQKNKQITVHVIQMTILNNE